MLNNSERYSAGADVEEARSAMVLSVPNQRPILIAGTNEHEAPAVGEEN